MIQQHDSELAASVRVSIAIPLLDEEVILPQLLQRLRGVLDSLPGGPHEVVFVDDGSTDRTFEILQAAVAHDGRIMAVRLSRNFGHQAALCAAMKHVTGDAVVLMDGDLQDLPEALPRLLETFRDGYDVVFAVRVARKEGLLHRACYWLFYRLIGVLAAIRLPLDSGDFCLMSRRVVDELNAMPERNRYLRGLRSWVGFRQIGIPVDRDGRTAGHSKYTLRKLLRLAFDGIFSFSVVPLRAASALGAVTVGLSALWGLVAIVARLFFDHSPQGFTALAVSIAFFAGVQLVFLGVIGEYIGRIYEEVKGRPHYIVLELVRNPWKWTPSTAVDTDNSIDIIGGGVLERH